MARRIRTKPRPQFHRSRERSLPDFVLLPKDTCVEIIRPGRSSIVVFDDGPVYRVKNGESEEISPIE